MTHLPLNHIIHLLKKLITIPSVSYDEDEILDFCTNWLYQHDFSEVVTQSKFVAGVIRANGKKPAKKALILCGHIDTVAPGDEEQWTHSPWESYEQDARIYGLGSGDMKAGVALNMIIAAEYSKQPRDDMDLWCVLVAREEIDGAGSAEFTKFFDAQESYSQAACLISEPTDSDKIEIGHKGNRFITFSFTGKSGHASQEAGYSSSALPSIVTFLNDLEPIRQSIHENYRDEQLGVPTLTPTRISSESSYSSNKTAAAAYLSVDIRTTPQLDAAFDEWMNQLSEKYSFSWKYDANPVNSATCATDAPILRTLKALTPSASIAVSPGATDQAFFQDIGIQTVVFGPGDFELAHCIDESVSVEKIERVAKTISSLTREIFQ